MFNDGSEIFYSLKQLLEMNDLRIRDLLQIALQIQQ